MSVAKSGKIVVIGAGAAGIYCGYLLKQQGFLVTILEARDRIGGRTYTLDGVDLGGTWVSTQQPIIYNLCQKFNLELIPQHESGNNIYINDAGRIVTSLSRLQIYTPEINHEHQLSFDRLNQLAKNLDLHDPFYQGLDQINVIQWLEQNFKFPETIATFTRMAGNLTTQKPSEFSILFLLRFIKSGRSLECLISCKNGAQEFRIRGGTKKLFDQLASVLDIRFNHQVDSVAQQDSGEYIVTTKNGDHYYADKVISALPVNLIKNVKWHPDLEEERWQLYDGMKMGSVTKLIIKYPHAFWQYSGYSGYASHSPDPRISTFDYSSEDYAAIGVFQNMNYSSRYYENDEILDFLATVYDDPLFKAPDKIYRQDWSLDEFSGGCYFCAPRIGNSNLYKYLQEPYKQIYFIGTETANEWYGYIEGALESAVRVLEQITS